MHMLLIVEGMQNSQKSTCRFAPQAKFLYTYAAQLCLSYVDINLPFSSSEFLNKLKLCLFSMSFSALAI